MQSRPRRDQRERRQQSGREYQSPVLHGNQLFSSETFFPRRY